MIEIKGLTKRFGDKEVLSGLDLTVPDGSIFGLVGMNGAGKSTLLRIMAGVYKADAGSVLLDGEDVFGNERAKRKLFFLPDEPFWSTDMTGASLAGLYSSVYDFDRARFDRFAELFELDEREPLRDMSKGMRRRMFVSAAFAVRPADRVRRGGQFARAERRGAERRVRVVLGHARDIPARGHRVLGRHVRAARSHSRGERGEDILVALRLSHVHTVLRRAGYRVACGGVRHGGVLRIHGGRGRADVFPLSPHFPSAAFRLADAPRRRRRWVPARDTFLHPRLNLKREKTARA